ncbi:MAG: regulatory protein RecX [Natronospirillum sp.]
MDFLARREYSHRELMERLHKRFPDESADTMAAVIAALAAEGLQSDERFAESYIRLRVSRGHGPAKIAFELLQRGIDETQSQPMLAEYDWEQLAREALLKKFSHPLPVDHDERARMTRFLQQRGYQWEQIDSAVG